MLKSLRKKHDVRVTQTKDVLLLNGKSTKAVFQLQNDLGNGTWGKIDFLVNHCGYVKRYVSEF